MYKDRENGASVQSLPHVYARLNNIAPWWRRVVASANLRVVILSPYVTSTAVLKHVSEAVPLDLYTEFSVELFASGGSSLRALKKILSWENTQLFWLPNLHAKIVLVDDEIITLGSQNLTARGEKNLEATAVVAEKPGIQQAQKRLDAWAAKAIPITAEMIERMESLLPPARKLYRIFRDACDQEQLELRNLYRDVIRQQEKYSARQQEILKRIAVVQEELNEAVDLARYELDDFCPNNQVSESLAREFIQRSAWWLTHSSGRPIPSRGDAEYIFYSGRWGWCWSMASKKRNDSNRFLVSEAIVDCKKVASSHRRRPL